MGRECPVFRVDSFAGRPFSGNPAGVCLPEQMPGDDWMQAVAGELNAPATAFVVYGQDRFELRWFSPVAQLKLCGHGTLAAAHILWKTGRVSAPLIEFATRSGTLSAARVGEEIELDFPTKPQRPADDPALAEELAAALDVAPIYVGRNDLDCLVEVATEEEVRRLAPNLSRLKALSIRGTIVTARAETAGFDFVSRFFAPSVGIDEDAATGSAHCCLGPHWAEKLGRYDLTAYQASARGATIRVKTAGDRVTLIGQAVTIYRGNLAL